ncbi:MAG TPA: hypothetical protein VGM39_06165 [Kofleriaceae bacterium]|jgi:hypothetical protein
MIATRTTSLLAVLTALAMGCAAEDAADPADDAPTCDDGKCDGASTPSQAGQPLSDADKATIRSLLAGQTINPGNIPDAMYVLHDTSGATSNSYMQQQADTSRGPLADGPAAYISADKVFYARPFFDLWRPTSTLYERGKDVMDETIATRHGRALWAKVSSADRTAAMAGVLDPLNLTMAERAMETSSASSQLAGDGDRLFTTATWTVDALCEGDYASDAECTALQAVTDARQDRISRSVNVEIGQIAGAGCAATGAPMQPYSAKVYDNAANLYLQTALIAGFYPETTTHFSIDKAFRGHCDPRCFDLGRFYSTVATKLGADAGTRYGFAPKYGTTWGTDNVWWSTSVCGGPAPR